MTHDQLIDAGERYLRDNGCGLVLKNPMQRWAVGERADVFGCFGSLVPNPFSEREGEQICPGQTVVLDAKTSLSDLKADRAKPWRQSESKGLGNYRLYVCEPQVIEYHDVEDAWGWGLLWAREDGHVDVVKHAPLWRKVNVLAQNVILAKAVLEKQHESMNTAKARKSTTLTAEQCARIREMAAEFGEVRVLEAARELSGRLKPGVMARRIVQAVESGQVEGVRARGVPAMLVAETNESAA